MVESTILLAACPKERSIKVIDFATGTVYFTFADSAPSVRGITNIGGPYAAEGLGSAGDYIASSQAHDHSVVFHCWGKTQPIFKCRTAEQLGPLLSTPDGLYLFAGGVLGNVYAWEVATGVLLKVWSAHFKAISCVGMTSDGAYLITGSEDTMTKAWAIADIVQEDESSANEGDLQPVRSWSEHSLPVTALCCTQGGPSSRIISCSLDHTTRIYDLFSSSTSCICSIRCPSGLSTVALDGGEKRLLLGSTLGEIYIVNVDVVAITRTASRAKIIQQTQEGGSSHSNNQEELHTLHGHTKSITALAWSWDGSRMISASEDGSIRVWDSDSHQCLKKIVFDTPGPISALLHIPKPHSLFQQRNSSSSSKTRGGCSLLPIRPLSKYRRSAGESSQSQMGEHLTLFIVKSTPAITRDRRVLPSTFHLPDSAQAAQSRAPHDRARQREASKKKVTKKQKI